MDCKKFLNGLRWEQQELNALKQQLESARLEACFRGASDAPKVKTSGSGDALVNAVIKIDELNTKYCQKVESITSKRLEAYNIIEQIESPRFRTLLIERYFNCKTWEEIAEAMGYEPRHIYRLHGEALVIFCHIASMV